MSKIKIWLHLSTVLIVVAKIGVCELRVCEARFSCLSCNKVEICIPNENNFIRFAVLQCANATPFCDSISGLCVELPSDECMKKNKYVCLKDGVYPAPKVCNKYYICRDRESSTVECLKGYVYDVKSETCVLGGNCMPFDCRNLTGRKVAHPVDRRLYTYCVDGKATYITSCANGEGMNERSQACEPTCAQDGYLPDPTDCASFYYCVSVEEGQYMISRMKCAEGTVFDRNWLQCVQPSLGYSCMNSTPTKYTPKYTFQIPEPPLQNRSLQIELAGLTLTDNIKQ